MKVAEIKNARPFATRNDKSLGIQTYGEGNDFPQRVQKIVGASGTGKSCVDVYKAFITGHGINDHILGDMVVNSERQTVNKVIRAAADDLAMFNGFALHVNYNAAYEIVELRHVPFEHLRFEKADDKTGEFRRVAAHPDWAREFEGIRKFKKTDIIFYDLFDPTPATILSQVNVAGGWGNYNGQIYYYSGSGGYTYPSPIFEPELTDMRSEEALSNVVNRNVANNFLTAGAIVDKNNSDQSEEEAQATQESIEQFQGDSKACSLMYMQVTSDDEVPEVLSFRGVNYDKEFTATQSYVPDRIGRVFNQPPILRAVDVGASFGADLMVNAYNYYNAKTSAERDILRDVFAEIMHYWWQELAGNDFSIRPLSFSSGDSLLARIGSENLVKVYEIMKDATTGNEQRRAILSIGYGLTDDEINALLPL